ncbi:MAG: hypothetical protein EBU85_06715, partial [Actinobacteria bacterium]|nr:hypothetical protein [Actinomycetota bacterium]
PLPKNLVSVVFDAVRNLPSGRPTPPDLTFASCPNPTLRADGDLGEGADILRGSLPYGSNGDVPATNQNGSSTGTGTGTDTTGTGTVDGTVSTGAGGSNSGVYSALQPTKLTVSGGAGTGLTFTAIAIGVAAVAPLAYVALRRRRTDGDTSESR